MTRAIPDPIRDAVAFHEAALAGDDAAVAACWAVMLGCPPIDRAVAVLEAAGYSVQEYHDGRRYIAALAPDLLAAVTAIIEQHGCRAEWSDDDAVIVEEPR